MRKGNMPELQIYATYETGTEVKQFQDYVELRYMNVSSLQGAKEQIRINDELMPRRGMSDKLIWEDASALVLYTRQFPINPIICRDVTDVFVCVYERESHRGIDVKLYLSTVINCPVFFLDKNYDVKALIIEYVNNIIFNDYKQHEHFMIRRSCKTRI